MVTDFGAGRGVVLPVRVDPRGATGPTKREAAGSEWRWTSRGLYVPAYVEPTAIQRVAEVGRLLPRQAIATGWASLCWQGGWWFTGTDHAGRRPVPVPVVAPRKLIREQSPLTLCRERWNPAEVVTVDGLPVAHATPAVCFAMRYARSVEDAVVALDLASFHDLVSIEEAAAWVDVHPSFTGIQRARDAVALADENAWSPQEPRLRLLLTRTGFGPFLTNRPVFDRRGRHLGTPDLIDPITGVTAEYDGDLHLAGSRRATDLRREHDLRSHGLTPVTMVAGDWALPNPFLMRVRAAYADAERHPVEGRRWTLDLPDRWRPTVTVAQRRELDDHDRSRLLHHRRAR